MPIHRAQGITEQFNEYEYYVNHMLWHLQSPDLSAVLVLSITIIKPSREGISFGRMMIVSQVQFQRLIESMPRCTEAILAACLGSDT